MNQRTPPVDREMWLALGALSAAAVIGISFGVIAVASGVPGRPAITMAVFMHADGARFLSVGLLVAGNPVAAVVGGFLLNARHPSFGLALGDTWWARPAGSPSRWSSPCAVPPSRSSWSRRRAPRPCCGCAELPDLPRHGTDQVLISR